MNEPNWLTMEIIETIQVDLIRTHGGHHGYRDKTLVEAALARPLNRWHYDSSPDIFSLAASYGYGLTNNHGFIDGNKRVAFIVMYIFLNINGYELSVPEQEVVDVILRLSSGQLDETELAEWLQNSSK